MLSGPASPRSLAISQEHSSSGPYFWLVAFFVVYCARPEDWIPGLQAVPLAKITGIFALLAFVSSVGQSSRRFPPEVVYLLLLFVQLCLTVPFALWRGGAFQRVLDFSKVVAIVPVVVLAVSTLERLRRLIFVQSASVVVIAVVSLLAARLTHGRLEGVLGGIYGNPNDLALAIVLTLPFCLAFMLGARDAFRKAAWCLAMAVMTYGLFLTASRSGMLAFLAAMVVLLWDFGVKGGRRYLLVVGVVALLAYFAIAGAGLKQRFGAAFEDSAQSAGDMSAHDSAVQRRQLLWHSLVVTAEHPLLGVGPGNFVVASGNWHVAHNSFSELSAEGGLPALILFILLFRRAFDNVRKVQLLVHRQTEEMLLVGAFRASLLGFAVGAFFASVEYHFFPYFLVAYTSALYAVVTKQACQAQPAERTDEALPERQSQGEGGQAAVTWADYERGRMLGSGV
jgi:hypothetical protein